MKFLFVHQNFPAQFQHMAPGLVRLGHEVTALSISPQVPDGWQGVRILRYQPRRGSTPGVHPWIIDLETKTIRGEAALHAARALRQAGYTPDAIVAHPAWGESLFLHEVWPGVPMGIHCEIFYQPTGQDCHFDPEFPDDADLELCAARLRMKNTNYLLHLDRAVAGMAPTCFQADSFPASFRQQITVVHEGIDTRLLAPDPGARLTVATVAPDAPFLAPGQPASGPVRSFSRQDEILTFVNRHFEPLRGCHAFLQALPELMERRPHLQVVMAGTDGQGYGASPPAGSTWRRHFWNAIAPRLPAHAHGRIHCTGALRRDDFTRLLQVSTVHVYLSYPFVLSWSLIEAMSGGCAIVGSDVAPVREAITHGEHGLLVDFFDCDALVNSICQLLDQPAWRQHLGSQARARAQAHYDLHTHCLPRQLEWATSLARPLA